MSDGSQDKHFSMFPPMTASLYLGRLLWFWYVCLNAPNTGQRHGLSAFQAIQKALSPVGFLFDLG